MNYANFWKRTAAYLLDYVIYMTGCGMLLLVIGIILGVSGTNPSEMAFNVLGLLISLVVYLLYYVWPEASAWQATLGKRIFGLKVTDLNGQRISFWRSLGRNVGMVVSSFILCIGYLMCFWTQQKQCLHDHMAGCLVVDNTPQEKQGCAVTVLVAFVIGCFIIPFVVGILAAIALPSYTKAVEKARATQAIVLLNSTQELQQVYQAEHRTYATAWDQFDLPVVSNDTFCLTPGQTCTTRHKFQLMLDKHAVTALRINTNNPYQLRLPYMPGSNIRCTAENNQCQRLGL